MGFALTTIAVLSLLFGGCVAQQPGPMENNARQTIANFQREINHSRRLQQLAQYFTESARNIDRVLRAGGNECITRNPDMLLHHTELFNNLTNGVVAIRNNDLRLAQGLLPPQAFGS